MVALNRFGRLLAAASVAVTLVACEAMSGKETAGQYVDDATITTRVKTALAADPVVKAREVSVETLKSEVLLSGFVQTREEAARAAKLASEVPGVRAVRNNLAVR